MNLSAPVAGEGPSMGGYNWEIKRTLHTTLAFYVVDRTT